MSKTTTNFMGFWVGLNAALRDNDLPEALFADARHYFEIGKEEDASAAFFELNRRVEAARFASGSIEA